MTLKEKAKTLPMLPGVYMMLDSAKRPIYVGKSKCLRNRVSSYFNDSSKWEKISKMIFLTKDISYIVCDTHLEARLLECDLIKKIKPHFNAQYKSDRSYVYIKIEKYNKYRGLTIVAKREEDTVGPFRHKYSVQETINIFSEIFPIMYQNDRYSFNYSLLPAVMDEIAFNMNREVLLKVFNDSNEMNKLIECLETKMKEDASNFLFETAAKYRDLVFRLNVLNNTIWRYTNVSNKDFVITIPVTDGVKYFYVSKGLILSKMTYEDDSYITVFLKECVNDSSTLDEKSYIDYRDIVCSEILNLPEDSLVSLS